MCECLCRVTKDNNTINENDYRLELKNFTAKLIYSELNMQGINF